jgi:D-sedoheptulose 7-phosphate isomerase
MRPASQLIAEFVAESLRVKAQFFEENKERIAHTAEVIAHGLRTGRKILFFGNGGSAADAQHLATEMVGRFGPVRSPLAAIALSTDSSILTAVGNDYGYENVFSRQIEALGQAATQLLLFQPAVIRQAYSTRSTLPDPKIFSPSVLRVRPAAK